MDFTARLSRLRASLEQAGLDGVVLVPGPSLYYLTGLSFIFGERPTVALLMASGAAAIVLPQLEAAKAEHLTGWQVFPYSDEEGYAGAFRRAGDFLGTGRRLGAEGLRMRLLEVRLLEQYAPACALLPADEMLGGLRVCKDEEELALMRRAVAVTEDALRDVRGQLRAGMTEQEVAARLKIALLRAGAEGFSFEPLVVAGPNSASPHASPGEHQIAPGEPLIVDCGATVGGYAADITRTFFIGPPAPEMARIYDVVLAANEAGRAAAGPGIPAEEVDRAARRVIEEAGYGAYFIHRTGHGLGLEIHESPFIVAGNRRTLEPGMTFTVEPGIYLPGLGGVRIEDDVVITADGAESLTTISRERTGGPTPPAA